jgi:hypothetical protein
VFQGATVPLSRLTPCPGPATRRTAAMASCSPRCGHQRTLAPTRVWPITGLLSRSTAKWVGPDVTSTCASLPELSNFRIEWSCGCRTQWVPKCWSCTEICDLIFLLNNWKWVAHNDSRHSRNLNKKLVISVMTGNRYGNFEMESMICQIFCSCFGLLEYWSEHFTSSI